MRTRRRTKNEEDIGDLIDRYLRSIDRSGKYLESKILSAWRQFGPMFQQYTRNIYFKNGILHVSISSASLKSELFMNKARLKDKLNEAIGQEIIKDILIY